MMIAFPAVIYVADASLCPSPSLGANSQVGSFMQLFTLSFTIQVPLKSVFSFIGKLPTHLGPLKRSAKYVFHEYAIKTRAKMAVCGVKVTKLTDLIHISASHIQRQQDLFVV